ncbi:MAG TPA: nucleotidyltransferase domain-containing protein [Solirubrobacterales bacterium]|nr:nucleotidyltransferase domain-containing protein [Solirubrobacterales bacterium]
MAVAETDALLRRGLHSAALAERERRVVAGVVAILRERLDERLLAVWLYGSRARNEADPAEVHPDRRSDVDLMVVVEPGQDSGQIGWEMQPLIEGIAEEEGDSPVWYSVLFYDADRLRERRRIESFFLREVDRDKLVLAGSALEGDRYR